MIDASIVWQMILSKMRVKKGYSVDMITDESDYVVCRLNLQSETLDTIQVVIESSSLPKKVKIEFTGSAPLETIPNVVNLHKICSHSAGLLDRFIVEATNNIPQHSIGRRASDRDLGWGVHWDRTNEINQALSKDFNYNNSFKTVESLIKSALQVLKAYDLVVDEPISSHWLVQESGVIISYVAMDNVERTGIANNQFVISFHKDGDFGFVAKCYLT